VTGKKLLPDANAIGEIRIGRTRSFRALLLLALCEGVVFYVTR
jgi:hypothetical protein